jgi:hypothetical protein
MRAFLYTIAILIAGSVALTACSSKKSSNRSIVQEFYVAGDPMHFVYGNQTRKIDFSFFADKEELRLVQYAAFRKKEEKENRSGSAENGNAPSEETERNTLPVLVNHNGANEVTIDVKAMDMAITLYNDDKGNGHARYTEEGTKFIADIEHFSISKDGNIMSLLISDKENGEVTTVVALYFARESKTAKLSYTDKIYRYLLGPGVKAGWTKGEERPFEICYAGENLTKVKYTAAKAGQDWQAALQERLKVEIKIAADPKPFSDLNQSCIYIVDDYLTEGDPGYVNFGSTLPIFETNGAPRIIDGDIFLFGREFQKNGGESMFHYANDGYFTITMVHEMGHLLGLDHEFTGRKSVMSYDFDTFSPSSHDTAAIRALYE